MTTIYNKLEGPGVYHQEVPFLETTGTFYQVGFHIGKTFSDRIQGHWRESEVVQDVLIPYAATARGQDYLKACLEVCKAAFPQYIDELQGMADGSGVPFENLFLLSSTKEIKNVLYPKERDTSIGCTDVLVNSPQCKIIAHNEDNYHLIDKFGYIIKVTIVEDGKELETFTSYCFPGCLAGNNTSFNRHGMVFTSDALYPNIVVENAPPRDFLSRSVIKAKSFDEAIALAKSAGVGVAYGFTLNMADVKNPSTMYSMEIGPQRGESNTAVHTLHEETNGSKPCHFIHVNSIEFLAGYTEIHNNTSSATRRERSHQMEAPKTRESALTILGDTAGQDYPIYREATTATDGISTIFITVADILNNRVEFYHGNPVSQGFKPSFHFQITDEKL